MKEMAGGGVVVDSRYYKLHLNKVLCFTNEIQSKLPVGDQWAGAGTTHFATAHV